MYRVLTDNPVDLTSADLKELLRRCPESPDGFLRDCRAFFNHWPISVLDLGCGENALIQAFYELGCLGIGLDIKAAGDGGSSDHGSYPPIRGQIQAFCDFSQPFEVINEGKQVKFDLITSWEAFEHIVPERTDLLCHNIFNHLSQNGIFLGSINLTGSAAGRDLHRNVRTEEDWVQTFRQYFDVSNYPFKERYRWQPHSMYVKLELPNGAKDEYKFGVRVCPNCRKEVKLIEGPKNHATCEECGYVATRYV